LARCPLDFDPLPGKFVQGSPALLERRIHRGDLRDRATETGHRLLRRLRGHPIGGAALKHLSLSVTRGGGDPEAEGRGIDLVGLEQKLGELGGLAETNRQHPGGERIQAAGMPGLGGVEQTLHRLQRLVGRGPLRFVEDENAVYGAPAPAPRHLNRLQHVSCCH